MRIWRASATGDLGIPDREGDSITTALAILLLLLLLFPRLTIPLQSKLSAAASCLPDIRRGHEIPFVDAGLTQRRQQDEVLLSRHLHVYVLVVVLVQRRYRVRVPDPQVDGVGFFVQRDPREGYGLLDLGE